MSQSDTNKSEKKEETKKPDMDQVQLDLDDLSAKVANIQSQLSIPQPKESLTLDEIKTNINTYGSWIYQGVMRSGTSVPTHSPKNREEQIYFYKNGSTYRLYVWIDGSWKYTSLT